MMSVLRSLAEGRILWAFWPPDTPQSALDISAVQGVGIWIPQGIVDDQDHFADDQDFEDDSDDETAAEELDDESSGSDDDATVSPESDAGEHVKVKAAGSRFSALAIEEEDDSEEDEE